MLIVSVFNFLKSPGSELKGKEEAFLLTSHLAHPSRFLSSHSLISCSSPLKNDHHHCPPKNPPAEWVVTQPSKVEQFTEHSRDQEHAVTAGRNQPDLSYLHRGRGKHIVDPSEIYVYLCFE